MEQQFLAMKVMRSESSNSRLLIVINMHGGWSHSNLWSQYDLYIVGQWHIVWS